MLLSDIVSWRALAKTIYYKNGEMMGKSDIAIERDNHYKTINSKHLLWARKGVYEAAYEEIMKKKVGELDSDGLKLIIDSTNISNKYGVEGIGYGTESRKKKFTKITIVSHETDPLAIHNHRMTENKMKQNHEVFEIKTLEHDVKGIVPVLEQMKLTKRVNLVGDKGYIQSDANKAEFKRTHKVTLVTPYRKNQRKRNTEGEKKLLKGRYKVENSISKIKRFHRITMRMDKKIISFMGFVFLAYVQIHSKSTSIKGEEKRKSNS